ncbi:hypothetical protein N431DRAFT_56440 [Stipitochalara longipes BDJ]|nr:hypothetical protein N431DRAFT_56440 [Stipitochalara longipes BDJ]
MDDREFSSPVCYLDYDNYLYQSDAKPALPDFCTPCTSFIDALHRNADEKNGIGFETLSSEEKLNFVLSQEGWAYKTANIAETAEEGCSLCVDLIETLREDERYLLMAWREDGRGSKGEYIFEFRRDMRGSQIRFRIVSVATKVDSVSEVKAGSVEYPRNLIISGQATKLPFR